MIGVVLYIVNSQISSSTFKHFEVDIITGVLDHLITPETKGCEDHPSESTMQQWHHWLMFNRLTMDGTLKSKGYQVLGFTEELLTSGVSLLSNLRKDTCDWLRIILRFIYNSGSFLVSVWNQYPCTDFCCTVISLFDMIAS